MPHTTLATAQWCGQCMQQSSRQEGPMGGYQMRSVRACVVQMPLSRTQGSVLQGVARMPVGRILGLAVGIARVAVRRIGCRPYVVTVHAQKGHEMGVMVVRHCHMCEHGQQGHQHEAGGQPVTECMAGTSHRGTKLRHCPCNWVANSMQRAPQIRTSIFRGGEDTPISFFSQMERSRKHAPPHRPPFTESVRTTKQISPNED